MRLVLSALVCFARFPTPAPAPCCPPPQVELLLTRTPKALPKLTLNPEVKNIFDFKYEDIQVTGYDPYPVIKAEVAV